jgi:hypothetical protein
MRMLRKLVPVMAATAAIAGTACACSSPSNPRTSEAAVFQTSRNPEMTVTVFSPTDTTLNFGLALYNQSAGTVDVKSMQLVSPAGAVVRDVKFTAYLARLADVPIALQGNLPKTCPEDYQPHSLSVITVSPHSTSSWVAVASFKIANSGRYRMGTVKIIYSTSGHLGWQEYYLGVTILASPAKDIPEYVHPDVCRKSKAS